jgi:isopentenyl-diphosphate delta-isomerase
MADTYHGLISSDGGLEDERIVLVDEDDKSIGTLGKLMVHRQGKLHRAFSVILKDGAGRLLLQRRAFTKYHSGGLWTNTCCGHPRPKEGVVDGAGRRLREEMGINCPLTPLFRTRYRATVSNGLIENEFVHVFGGHFEGMPRPESNEVEDWRWETLDAIAGDIARRPHTYTPWFIKYVTEFQSTLL